MAAETASQAKAPAASITNYLRVVGIILFFLAASICINLTQFLGYPLKLVSPSIYRTWVDLTRQSFGILIVAINEWGAQPTMHIGGDKSVCALFAQDVTNKNAIISKFGDRAIVIGNHQLYNDWMHLWWSAYSSRAHGGIFIILKDSLKKIPILGWGMQLYEFIFLSRKWATDQEILVNGLKPLTTTFKNYPAWLVLFPEGTTLSANGKRKMLQFAEKSGASRLPERLLLPRSRGIRFSIEQLAGSMEYLYDATIHYSGIPEGQFGEDYYTLRRVYLLGVYPKDVSIYWRRYKISDIPYHDEAEFDKWLETVWFEKDEILKKIDESGLESVSFFKPLVAPQRLESLTEIFQIVSFLLSAIIILNLLRTHTAGFIPPVLLSWPAIIGLTAVAGVSTRVLTN